MSNLEISILYIYTSLLDFIILFKDFVDLERKEFSSLLILYEILNKEDIIKLESY